MCVTGDLTPSHLDSHSAAEYVDPDFRIYGRPEMMKERGKRKRGGDPPP